MCRLSWAAGRYKKTTTSIKSVNSESENLKKEYLNSSEKIPKLVRSNPIDIIIYALKDLIRLLQHYIRKNNDVFETTKKSKNLRKILIQAAALRVFLYNN